MQEKSAPQQVSDIIALYDDWRGATLTQIRSIIHEAAPEIVEEVKWKMPTRPLGLPVWSHNGMLCRAEIFKNDLKLVFSKGAQMSKLQQYFNARLKSGTERAIEFHESDAVDKSTLTVLVREAIALNISRANKK